MIWAELGWYETLSSIHFTKHFSTGLGTSWIQVSQTLNTATHARTDHLQHTSSLLQPQFTRPGFISNAVISTFFCAAVSIACLLVCLEVGLVTTAGDEA